MEFSIKIIQFQTVLSGLKHEEKKRRRKNPYYDIPILNWKFHKNIFVVNPFLRLYSKFQSPTLPETGQKVCVHVFVVGGVA